MIRVVATDLDGTLLHSEYRVSTRTVEALRRVQDLGALVVPVTARPPRMTYSVAREFDIRGLAICGNGALVVDLEKETVLEHRSLDAAIARRMIEHLREEAPGVLFAAEMELDFAYEPGYTTLIPQRMATIADALEFVAAPVSKLIVKHPEMPHAVLLAAAERIVGEEAHVRNSGDTWVEIHAAGVTKGATLEALCMQRGITAGEVVAFGDFLPDIPMLTWAGLGVATANAHPAVLAAADEVAPSNNEDGVAQVLERLLGEGRIGNG